MRLLICTQGVDKDDPALGFFHEWIVELSKHFTSIEVVCLSQGRHSLPESVRVYSLGKESGRKSRLYYAVRFISLIVKLRSKYDVVFVHQNQEYVLLAGWLWRGLGKKVFMWRNHYAGSYVTDIAASLCDTVFCTSKHSYTMRYAKTVRMPIGVDTDIFVPDALPHAERSILFLGRIAPSKRPDILVEALGLLKERSIASTAVLCGPTLRTDEDYKSSLIRRIQELHLTGRVSIRDGVPHTATPTLYATHEVFVNLSGSGMYDKTLFEAAASGCIVVALSRDFEESIGRQFIPKDESAHAVADTLQYALTMSLEEKTKAVYSFRALAEANSLTVLGSRLAKEMNI